MSKSESIERLLTETELELMRILWSLGQGTVRDVMAALPEGRDLAYTSVSTMLRILEQKGFVTAAKAGRSHIYTPAVEKPRYEARTLRHMVGGLFEGSAGALVRRLIDSGAVDDRELRDLQQLLDERLGGDE